MVAAVLGESDPFYQKCVEFLGGIEETPLLLMRSVFSEYEVTAEGIGRDDENPGRIEKIIGDLYHGVTTLDSLDELEDSPSDAIRDLALSQQAERIITEVLDDTGSAEEASKVVRDVADAFEHETAMNKLEFFTHVSIVGPIDRSRVENLSAAMVVLVDGAGRAWENDTDHIAQTHVYAIEVGDEATFVTEDRRHFRPERCTEILDIVGEGGLTDICDLGLVSLGAL